MIRIGSRAIAIILLILLTLPVMSGCVHLNLGKRIIAGPDKEEPTFVWKDKLLEKWAFQTVLAKPEETVHHASQNNTSVIKDTKVMQFSLDISMAPLPGGISLPAQVPRYVEVSLSMPDGTVWFQGKFDSTYKESLEIDTPMDGDWLLNVDGYGYGVQALGVQDYYEVSIRCLEPE